MFESITKEELEGLPNLHISGFGVRGYMSQKGVSTRALHQIDGMQECLSAANEPWWVTFGMTAEEFSNTLEELTEGYIPQDGEYSLVASWEPSEENLCRISVEMLNNFSKKSVKLGWISEVVAQDFFLQLFEGIVQNNQDEIKKRGDYYFSKYEIPCLTLGMADGLSDFASYEEQDEFCEEQWAELTWVLQSIVKSDPGMKKFLFWLIRYNIELSFSRHFVFTKRKFRNIPDKMLTEAEVRQHVQYVHENEINWERQDYAMQTLKRDGETLSTRGIYKLEFYSFDTAAVKEEGLWKCAFNNEYGRWPKYG